MLQPNRLKTRHRLSTLHIAGHLQKYDPLIFADRHLFYVFFRDIEKAPRSCPSKEFKTLAQSHSRLGNRHTMLPSHHLEVERLAAATRSSPQRVQAISMLVHLDLGRS